ncbi:hypothetical protein D3C75_992420 [compost metagenome]
MVGVEAFALEDLDQEVAARTQHAGGQIQGQLAQVHGARLVGRAYATHIGGHVGNHKVDRMLADRLEDLREHHIVGEVALDEGDIGDAVHRQDVRGDQAPLVADHPTGDLRPAARRRAEVDHGHARPQDAVLLLDFQQFVAGARTVAVLLRHLHVGIVEMLFQPTLAGLGTGHGIPHLCGSRSLGYTSRRF